MAKLTEDRQRELVRAYVAAGGKISNVVKLTGASYNAVYAAVGKWHKGKLDVEGLEEATTTDAAQVILRKLLEKEKGIEFAISESADQPYRIFSTRYLLTHGDQFRGGSGISGMLSPLLLGDARKRQRETAVRRSYDYMVMGHWHQLAFVRGMIINGSSKGFDEYAFVSNFQFEPPRQAFWITDPTHGVTITAPIHVIDASEIYTAESGHQATATMGTI